MMLTQLADVARKAGLTVVEVPGWRARGHGAMSGVRTVTCHHTANGGAAGNAPSLTVVQQGRPGLTGPLAHFVLAKNGTVFVVAAGLCYHAGVSLKTDYTNEFAVGIEAEAVGVPGTAGDWPAVQMDAYHRLCRALIDHFGLDVADVRGHKETCSPPGRKSDPDFDMTKFRAAVAAVNLGDPPDMPLTPAEWTRLEKLLHDTVVDVLTTEKLVDNRDENNEPTASKFAVTQALAGFDQKLDYYVAPRLREIVTNTTPAEPPPPAP